MQNLSSKTIGGSRDNKRRRTKAALFSAIWTNFRSRRRNTFLIKSSELCRKVRFQGAGTPALAFVQLAMTNDSSISGLQAFVGEEKDLP